MSDKLELVAVSAGRTAAANDKLKLVGHRRAAMFIVSGRRSRR